MPVLSQLNNRAISRRINKGDTISIVDYYQSSPGMYPYFITEFGDSKEYVQVRQIELLNISEDELKLKLELIEKIQIEQNKALALRNAEKEQRIEKDEERRYASKKAQQKLKREQELTKTYGTKIAKDLMLGRIWIGMSSEMARLSWGRPKDINRSVGTWGVHEQWVYSSSYLYFENDRLASYQN